MTKAWATQRN